MTQFSTLEAELAACSDASQVRRLEARVGTFVERAARRGDAAVYGESMIAKVRGLKARFDALLIELPAPPEPRPSSSPPAPERRAASPLAASALRAAPPAPPKAPAPAKPTPPPAPAKSPKPAPATLPPTCAVAKLVYAAAQCAPLRRATDDELGALLGLGSRPPQGERALWVDLAEPPVHVDLDALPAVSGLAGRRRATELVVRDGPSLRGAAAVAVAFDDGEGVVAVVPALGYESRRALEALVAAAAGARDAHAYASPAALDTGAENAPEDDAYWSTYGGGAAAKVYRDHIDALILNAIEDLPTPATIGELCGGEGSLAARALERFPAADYVLYERNAVLAAAARARGLCVRCGDVHEELSLAPADLWIASGSVLCAHVGARDACGATLARLRGALADGGHVVVTGFTTTWLTPRLLRDAGLRAVRGSVPVPVSAPSLETAFGRFHLWVLRAAAGPLPRLYGALCVEAPT